MEIWKEGGMMILDYPKIYKEKELIGQGGNQDWFADSWLVKLVVQVLVLLIFLSIIRKENVNLINQRI